MRFVQPSLKLTTKSKQQCLKVLPESLLWGSVMKGGFGFIFKIVRSTSVITQETELRTFHFDQLYSGNVLNKWAANHLQMSLDESPDDLFMVVRCTFTSPTCSRNVLVISPSYYIYTKTLYYICSKMPQNVLTTQSHPSEYLWDHFTKSNFVQSFSITSMESRSIVRKVWTECEEIIVSASCQDVYVLCCRDKLAC